MKADCEQYFPVVLFIMLYKVILTFESVDEILKCDQSNKSYWSVLSRGTVYYALQGGSNFWVCAGMDETRQYQSGSKPLDKKWGRSSKPWDKGGGGRSQKNLFRPFGPQFGLKISGGGSPGPSPRSVSEQYFPVVLFIMLYKVVLTFAWACGWKCDHSNESYWAVIFWHCLLYYTR